MIDDHKFFDQKVKNDISINDSIRELATDPGNDYISCFLLDYAHFKENVKLIAIDRREQQAFNPDSKIIQKIYRKPRRC